MSISGESVDSTDRLFMNDDDDDAEDVAMQDPESVDDSEYL
jgi:hypothetical protein